MIMFFELFYSEKFLSSQAGLIIIMEYLRPSYQKHLLILVKMMLVNRMMMMMVLINGKNYVDEAKAVRCFSLTKHGLPSKR